MCHEGGTVGYSVRPASVRFVVRFLAATDLGCDSSTAERLTAGVSVTEMTIINGRPVAQ